MRWWLGYLILGVGLAVACDRRQLGKGRWARLASALLCVALWPLWAPVALLPAAPGQASVALALPCLLRVEQTLDEARRAVLGTGLESLLPEAALARVLSSVQLVETRYLELGRLLQRAEFQGSQETTGSFETWRNENVLRLRQLRERDERMLQELCNLVEALRMQLLLARYSGGSADGARDIVSELGAQVESLGEWFALDVSFLHQRTV